MKLFDIHCHLDFPQYDENREEVIEKCREKLFALITSGTKFDTNKNAIELSNNHKGFIFSTLGCHPVHAVEMNEEEIERIKNQIEENRNLIVGIGEIGLDYFHNKERTEREKQRKIFEEFLELAEKLKLPVVIHSRDAEKHAIETIKNYNVCAIFHCFNADLTHLKKAEEISYISISTQVLYSKRVMEIAKNVQLDRILLETDSPFLARGEINFPWRVTDSFKKIAELRNLDNEDLYRILTNNLRNAFPDLKILWK